MSNRKSSGRMASKGMPNPIDVAIGAKIRQLRILRGITQEKLGEALGLTFQQCQKYERGGNRISGSRIFDLCQFFGIQANDLFADIPASSAAQSPAHLAKTGAKPIQSIHSIASHDRVVLETAKLMLSLDEGPRRKVHHIVKEIVKLASGVAE